MFPLNFTTVGAGGDALSCFVFPYALCWARTDNMTLTLPNNVKALTCLLSEPRLWKISRVFTLWLQVLPSAAVTQLDPEEPLCSETEQNIAMILMVPHKSPVIAHCLEHVEAQFMTTEADELEKERG